MTDLWGMPDPDLCKECGKELMPMINFESGNDEMALFCPTHGEVK